jgi:hypothetical protein
MAKIADRAPNRLYRSLLLFLVLFGLLVFPWPGFDELYGSYFRGFGMFFLGRNDSTEVLRFDRHILVHDFTTLNTQISLSNPQLADAQGNYPGVQTSLDTRSIGWVPTALTMALIAASPIPWRRKIGALAVGVVLVHLLILFTVETWIWSESPAVSLLHLSAFEQRVADALRYTFLEQLGVSFSAPILIWLLTTFRRQDAARLFGGHPRTAQRS